MKLFTQHPNLVGETYFQHLKEAFCIGGILIKISLIAFIHGLFPFWFTTTASEMVFKLSKELLDRRKNPIESFDLSNKTTLQNRNPFRH